MNTFIKLFSIFLILIATVYTTQFIRDQISVIQDNGTDSSTITTKTQPSPENQTRTARVTDQQVNNIEPSVKRNMKRMKLQGPEYSNIYTGQIGTSRVYYYNATTSLRIKALFDRLSSELKNTFSSDRDVLNLPISAYSRKRGYFARIRYDGTASSTEAGTITLDDSYFIMAYRNPDRNVTSFLTFYYPQGFRLGSGDSSKETNSLTDLNIQSPSQSRKVLELRYENSRKKQYVSAFRTPLSRSRAKSFYHEQFSSNGWTTFSESQNLGMSNSDSQFFQNKQYVCAHVVSNITDANDDVSINLFVVSERF